MEGLAVVPRDGTRAYLGLPFSHEAVKHSVDEYARGQAYTNGSPKRLDRCITEFVGRHNDREADAIGQMAFIARGIVGKRLTYANLVA